MWRKYRGLTLASLARSVGVSRGYLSQIENGHKSGTLDLFRRLSGALDVSMDQLVEPVSGHGHRSGWVRGDRLFFCHSTDRRTMMPADRSVRPTCKPASSPGRFLP